MILGLPMLLRGRHGVFVLARLWGATSLWLLERDLRPARRISRPREHSRRRLHPRRQAPILPRNLRAARLRARLRHHAQAAAGLHPAFRPLSRRRRPDRHRPRARAQRRWPRSSPRRARWCARGRQVFIFPEGTRRPPGAPPRYKFGVAALYAETGAPCLPVALNTGLFWGRRGFTRRPGVAVIEYLPPIPPGLDRDAFAARLQATIETACDRLNAEAHRRRSAPCADPGRRRGDDRRAEGRRNPPRGLTRLRSFVLRFVPSASHGDGSMLALLDAVSPCPAEAPAPDGERWPEPAPSTAPCLAEADGEPLAALAGAGSRRRASAPGGALRAALHRLRLRPPPPARPIATRC